MKEYEVIERDDVDKLNGSLEYLAGNGWCLVGPVMPVQADKATYFVATMERDAPKRAPAEDPDKITVDRKTLEALQVSMCRLCKEYHKHPDTLCGKECSALLIKAALQGQKAREKLTVDRQSAAVAERALDWILHGDDMPADSEHRADYQTAQIEIVRALQGG